MTHLTKAQLAELKQALLDARQQLRVDIRDELMRSDDEHYADLAGQAHDPGDESIADLLVDSNIAAVGRYIAELREVEAALERMDMGSYGRCEECDEEIPYERLKVQPTARRDIEHQARHEQAFGESHTPRM
ncbi:MAG: TraR/DksA family transcriptional regulator [Gammaproteobacteria bacterium]|nr:TraR/DksA family transcriptional regulator [Gammaproteobacteria bacterium]